MTSKRVILARPNPIIINEMKRILTEAQYIPTPIDNLNQLNQYSIGEINGVVISTALNSTVKEDYDVTVKEVINKFNNVPIILASLISLDKIKKTILSKFEKIGLNFDLLSIEEALNKNSFNPKKEIILIQKKR